MYIIRNVAKETLGMSTGKPKVYKESWWWNEEVQKKIKDKNIDSRSSWLARRRRIGHIRRRGIKKQNGRQKSSSGGKRLCV